MGREKGGQQANSLSPLALLFPLIFFGMLVWEVPTLGQSPTRPAAQYVMQGEAILSPHQPGSWDSTDVGWVVKALASKGADCSPTASNL